MTRHVIGLVALYGPGRPLTDELHSLWPEATRAYRASRGNCFQAPEAMRLALGLHRQVVAFGSLATVVGLLADGSVRLPHGTDLLCVDPRRRWVIPVTHGDGAEELAREVSAALGVTPVFTAAAPGPEQPPVRREAPRPDTPALRVSDGEDPDGDGLLVHPRTLVAGIGAAGGAGPDEALRLLLDTLGEAGLAPTSVARLATVTGKADHPAVRRAARALGGVPVDEHPAERLAAVPVPNPSDAVGAAVGTASVAEAAALASAPGGRLVVAKRKSARTTVAVARGPLRGRLALVCLAPGTGERPPPHVLAELRRASAVVGEPEAVEAVAGLLRPWTRRVAVPRPGSLPDRAGEVLDRAGVATDGDGRVVGPAGAAAALASHGHEVALVALGADTPTAPPGPYDVHRVPRHLPGPPVDTHRGDPA